MSHETQEPFWAACVGHGNPGQGSQPHVRQFLLTSDHRGGRPVHVQETEGGQGEQQARTSAVDREQGEDTRWTNGDGEGELLESQEDECDPRRTVPRPELPAVRKSKNMRPTTYHAVTGVTPATGQA